MLMSKGFYYPVYNLLFVSEMKRDYYEKDELDDWILHSKILKRNKETRKMLKIRQKERRIEMITLMLQHCPRAFSEFNS